MRRSLMLVSVPVTVTEVSVAVTILGCCESRVSRSQSRPTGTVGEVGALGVGRGAAIAGAASEVSTTASPATSRATAYLLMPPPLENPFRRCSCPLRRIDAALVGPQHAHRPPGQPPLVRVGQSSLQIDQRHPGHLG